MLLSEHLKPVNCTKLKRYKGLDDLKPIKKVVDLILQNSVLIALDTFGGALLQYAPLPDSVLRTWKENRHVAQGESATLTR